VQIAIVLYPGLTALDAIGPYEVLRLLPNAEIRFVGHETGPITTDSGVLVLGATHTLAETPRPDVVLVPGSSIATATAAADERLLAWLRATDRHTAWTTSVCTGAVVLASAGLLEGRPATTHWSMQKLLGQLGAVPQRDERIVRSDKYLTSAGVSAGIDLALTLAAQVADRTTAEAIQLAIEYDPQPPFDAGHLSKASGTVKAATGRLYARGAADTLVADPGALAHETTATGGLLWRSAIDRVRARRRRGRRRNR
jgi:transcriptional regulator GlxA family with amidase domain